jgi:AraC-like DNA-binding protein
MKSYKIVFFIIYTLCFCFFTYGQSEDVELLNTYLKKALKYGFQKKIDSANIYLEKAWQFSNKINDPKIKARVINNNSRILFWQVEIDSAKNLLKQNIENTTLNSKIKNRALLIMGTILQYEKKYSKALNQYIRIEKNIRRLGIRKEKDSLILHNIYLQMALIHMDVKNIKKAHSFFNKSLSYSSDDFNSKNDILYYKSMLYDEENNLRESINYSIKGVKISKSINNKLLLPSYYRFISNSYLKLNKGDSAIFYGKKGLIDNNHCQVEFLNNNIGKGYLLSKDYQKSLFYFKNALEHATISTRIEVHKNMRDAYIALKKYKKAINHNKKYLVLKKTVDSLKIRQQLLEITKKYDSEKNILEIEILQSKNKHNAFVINKKNNQILLISIILISLITFLIFIVFSNKKQKKQKNLLFVKNRQLAQKAKNIENTNHKRKKIESTSIDIIQKEKINNAIKIAIQNDFYLDKSISLAKLAKQLQTNTSYLSKVINEDYKKSFAVFINDLRISNTLKKLESMPKYKTLTIENIADKAGFSSSSAFYNAFKNFTGLTPSYYIKKRLLKETDF